VSPNFITSHIPKPKPFALNHICAVVGQMKMILSTGIGAIMFGTSINSKQATGLAINTVGGFVFAWGKHREAARGRKSGEGDGGVESGKSKQMT
jgi:hypothetical protein